MWLEDVAEPEIGINLEIVDVYRNVRSELKIVLEKKLSNP